MGTTLCPVAAIAFLIALTRLEMPVSNCIIRSKSLSVASKAVAVLFALVFINLRSPAHIHWKCCDCLGALRGPLVDSWSRNKREAGNDLFSSAPIPQAETRRSSRTFDRKKRLLRG
jgi:hypothetical protein